MGGGNLVGLAAGEEGDARNRGRHAAAQAPDRFLCDFLDSGLDRVQGAGHHHVRLEDHALEDDTLAVELVEQRDERGLRDVEAAIDVVVAVHQHLGLDDRHDPRLLAERGVAGERVGIGVDAIGARDVLADVDDRAPLGEAGAELVIFGSRSRRPSRPSVIFSPGAAARSLAPVSTLMPGTAPASAISLTSGVPSAADWRMVSS
jgi:hypothetical protein